MTSVLIHKTPSVGCERDTEDSRNRSTTGGFTLIEFIIALTMLGLMGAVMFSSFRVALNSYTRSQDRIEARAIERAMESLIRHQVGSLFPIDANFLAGEEASLEPQLDPTRRFGRQPLPNAFAGPAPLFHGGPNAMTFITIAPLRMLENPGLAVVRYGLAQDEYGDHYFGAMEARYVGVESFDAMVEIPPGKPLTVRDGVTHLEFEYYGYDRESDTFDWFDEWSGEERASVPSAVRIRIDDREIMMAVNTLLTGGGAAAGAARTLRDLIRQ